MGKKYLETKGNSLESSILGLWQEAAGTKKDEELSKKQKKLDVDGDGEIEGSDLAKLRKKGAKKEGNSFGKALMAAKEKGDKTFVVAGKTYEVKEEVDLDEAMPPMSDDELSGMYHNVIKWMERGMSQKGALKKLAKEMGVTRKETAAVKKKLDNAGFKEAKESYEIGTDEYRMHTQGITPGQEITDYQRFKVESMKEALAKVWGLDEARPVGTGRQPPKEAKSVTVDLENDDPKLLKDIKRMGLKIKDNGDSGNAGYIEYTITGPASKLKAGGKKFGWDQQTEEDDKDLTKASKSGKVITGSDADEIDLKPKTAE